MNDVRTACNDAIAKIKKAEATPMEKIRMLTKLVFEYGRTIAPFEVAAITLAIEGIATETIMATQDDWK